MEWTKESLSKKLFEMLSEGKSVGIKDVDTIEGFYRSVKKIHGSYECFLIDNGLDPNRHMHRNRNLSTINSQLGLLFEDLLGDLLKDIGSNYIRETVNGMRPDFIVRSATEEKWIDAKLTEETALKSQTIVKYGPHCDKLMLVYLIGHEKDYLITKNVRITHVNSLMKVLKDEDSRSKYVDKFERIKKIYQATKKEIISYGETEDY